MIFDWKRVRAINFDNSFRPMRPPLEHLPDSNYWMYALQLNLYAYILESEYGYEVGGMYLAVVSSLAQRPRCIEVPRMGREIAIIVQSEIECGRAGKPRPGETSVFAL